MTLDGGRAQAAFCATLVDEWARAGVGHAVVAPGSRSTPLALAVAAEDRLAVHVHLDERSAAFFALGLGLATGRPAVVVTTSGTAAVELHPAVVEAHQAGVPLLVCTADRPPELHHVGAPQTVEQARLFAGAVRWAFEPGVAGALPAQAWRSVAARAVAEAVGAGPGSAAPGPVHLNLAFGDPLVAEPGAVPPGRPDSAPWHQAFAGGSAGGQPGVPGAVLELLDGRRGVVVAGRLGAFLGAGALAAALGWPVLADPRSGMRACEQAVCAFDPLLRVEGWVPPSEVEVVVRVGDPPASKVLGQWLAGLDVPQVLVHPHRWADPERTAAALLPTLASASGPAGPPHSPGSGGSPGWGPVAPAPDGWLHAWRVAERAAQAAVDEALADAGPSPTEPAVARGLTAGLDAGDRLVVSSSMPVRDVEWFGAPGSTVEVLANRGANGIDGVVSTALGVAAADPDRRTVALLGDLALLHDAGGLLWARRRRADCCLVVVDNDGGGIFSFLPQAAQLPGDRFEQLFGTPHGIDLAALASVHGVPVTPVERIDDLLPAVRAGTGVRMVHVRTDRAANVAVHERLHAAVAAAVRSL